MQQPLAGLGVTGNGAERLVQFVGQLGHHLAHGAQPGHVGQLGLVLLHLLLGAAAFVHFQKQPAVGLGQFLGALPDALLQLFMGLPQLLLGPHQTLGLPRPFQALDRPPPAAIS